MLSKKNEKFFEKTFLRLYVFSSFLIENFDIEKSPLSFALKISIFAKTRKVHAISVGLDSH